MRLKRGEKEKEEANLYFLSLYAVAMYVRYRVYYKVVSNRRS